MGSELLLVIGGEGLWFPTLAPEKRRKDGARKVLGFTPI
jgi:hypothetical protein